jgi:methionyl aminopeptidase
LSITTEEELRALQAAGAVVRRVLDTMKAEVRPGVTTRELDEVGTHVIRAEKANSAPAMVYAFPGGSCISLNDEAVHGIPGNRRLKNGDLLKLDVTVEKDGLMADAAVTVPVGTVSDEGLRLLACAERAFHAAMLVARAGFRVFEIGRAVERVVLRDGFAVIRELGGHGIGRTIHEQPHVPNYLDRSATRVLTEGMVIAVEPIIAAGSGQVFVDKDGWTVRTVDGKPSAHYEHTLIITTERPLLVTSE